jgi:acyl carrier protein
VEVRVSLLARLETIFRETLDYRPASFTLDVVPEDVPNWDSIGHMNLVFRIEQEFQLQLDVDEIMEMSSVRKISEIVKGHGIPE